MPSKDGQQEGYTEIIKGHLKAVRDVLFRPISFFEDNKNKKLGTLFGTGPLGYITYLALLSAIVDGLLMLPFFHRLVDRLVPLSTTSSLSMVVYLPLAVVLMWVVILLIMFIASAYNHLFVKLVGGNGDYWDTYRIFVYSSTPGILLGSIPGIPSAVQLWSILLLAAGIKVVHETSWLRSIAAVVLATVVPFVLLAILAYIMFPAPL